MKIKIDYELERRDGTVHHLTVAGSVTTYPTQWPLGFAVAKRFWEEVTVDYAVEGDSDEEFETTPCEDDELHTALSEAYREGGAQ